VSIDARPDSHEHTRKSEADSAEPTQSTCKQCPFQVSFLFHFLKVTKLFSCKIIETSSHLTPVLAVSPVFTLLLSKNFWFELKTNKKSQPPPEVAWEQVQYLAALVTVEQGANYDTGETISLEFTFSKLAVCSRQFPLQAGGMITGSARKATGHSSVLAKSYLVTNLSLNILLSRFAK
jgi:hypothetical protein